MIFSELSAPKLRAVSREKTLVVVPIAAVEQHGPHLPTGTDMILCTAVATALEQRVPNDLLLTPTIWLGASSHHLRFGATLDSSLDNYINTLSDTAISLLEDGFKRVLFLNGHGGNVDPMRIAVRQLQPNYPDCLLAAGSYWSAAEEVQQDLLQGDHKSVGHACEFETSLMLHIRPDLVDQQSLHDAGPLVDSSVDGVFISRDMAQRTAEGYTGRPDLATAETGGQLFEHIVTALTETTRQLVAQPLATEYREFVEFAAQDQR